jgi:hypothetical protein
MAILDSSSPFVRYTLTPEEEALGYMLNPAQRVVIQNLIADRAEAKVMATIDANNINSCLQSEAELHGAINILKYLLDQDTHIRSTPDSD